MAEQLGGIHHLTAITADAPGNLAFYTQVLGLQLVKKTVNQDDTAAYHLFYAEAKRAPAAMSPFSTGRSVANGAAPTHRTHRVEGRKRSEPRLVA